MTGQEFSKRANKVVEKQVNDAVDKAGEVVDKVNETVAKLADKVPDKPVEQIVDKAKDFFTTEALPQVQATADAAGSGLDTISATATSGLDKLSELVAGIAADLKEGGRQQQRNARALAKQAAGPLDSVAAWLEHPDKTRGHSVRRFVRRHPVAVLSGALAAGVGLGVGLGWWAHGAVAKQDVETVAFVGTQEDGVEDLPDHHATPDDPTSDTTSHTTAEDTQA